LDDLAAKYCSWAYSGNGKFAVGALKNAQNQSIFDLKASITMYLCQQRYKGNESKGATQWPCVKSQRQIKKILQLCLSESNLIKLDKVGRSGCSQTSHFLRE
jgi:hypothetical protein